MLRSILRQESAFAQRFFNSLRRGTHRRVNRIRANRRRNACDVAQQIETIEDRTLLTTLVALDLGAGSGAAEWTQYNTRTDTTLTDVKDENGVTTAVDIDVNFDGTDNFGFDSFSPAANQLPSHSVSLAGVDRTYADRGDIRITFEDLTPGADYELYVFAGDSFASSHTVQIFDKANDIFLDNPIDSFTQTYSANQLVVNDAVGSDQNTLESYARVYQADSNGDLTVRVSSASSFGLAGIAISEAPAAVPKLSINDVSVAENVAGGQATFRISLDAAAATNVTVDYVTADETASAGSDYTAVSTTNVTIPAGSTFVDVDVAITDDAIAEPDETFVINLSNPVNATIDDAQGQGTITNDDAAATPIDIVLDYTFDTNGFFSTATADGQAARALLETAAGIFEARITDSLDAITPGPSGSGFDNTWTAIFSHPGTGATQNVVDLAIGANEIIVYAGGRDLATPTLGEGGPGGFSSSGTAAWNAGVARRGEADNTDFGPWGGAITFDSIGTTWNLDEEDPVGGESDFFSVALHELGHLMGFGTSTSFANLISGANFTGVQSTAANGGVNPGIDVGLGHWAGSVNGTLLGTGTTQDALMTPTITAGSRKLFTEIDFAGLDDLGWDVTLPAAPVLMSVESDGLTAVTEGGVTDTLVVSLSRTPNADVTVTLTPSNNEIDLGSGAGMAHTVTFTAASGATGKVVTVTAVDDAAVEGTHTASIAFTTASTDVAFNTLSTTAATVTITDNDTPQLSVNDVSVAENIAGGAATFRISIDTASGQDITVDYATANGSATAGSDYTAVAATSATIAAGTTFVDVTVDITNDTFNEPDETYFVNLTNPANATIDDAQGLGTITNDDGLPKISINDVSVAENIAGGKATFRISIDAASGQDITVDYATANGSANAGSDYTAVAATSATITAGTTFVDVTVDITNDTINEPDETYFVNLTNPANATIDDAQGLGTITNDDGLPKISINDVSVAENIAGGKATFRISIDAASGQDITVDYATANGSAIAGSDYTAVAATSATITAGTTFVDVTVDITNDAINEPDETYFVNLTNPANATIDDAQGLGTITNDDGLPKISINDVSVAENIAGGKATFRISIDAASGQDITVDYATANGSATAGSDYTAVAATSATIAAGTTFVDVTVDITNDTFNEPDETYFVNLTNPANATIDDAQGLGTITNDDGLPKISINDVSVAENIAGGAATFRISIDTASGQDITVDYATANGSATAGSDYTAVAATAATITAGTTFVDVTVDITNDAINEPDETYFVNLTNPANATIDDAQGLGTITNDDGLPKISINDVSVAENIAGGKATFRISIDTASGQDITLDYATANGSATAGSDYTAVAATTATITAGTTFVDVTVDITNDTINEPDETYFVNLTNPANATIDDAQGLGTITNDDDLPKISINDVSVAENIAGGAATFRISIDTASGQDITVDYATADGSATAGSDYTAVAATTATITAGTTFVDVTVDITNDTINEPDETYFVNLTNPANATIDDAQGLGTITNDDGLPKISINDVSVAENIAGGKATFRISIDAASGQDITVDYATANGSATAGSDYTAVAATAATITAGTTFVDVTVDITNDAINEPDETYFVNLTNPANATIDDAQGLGTITNDDGLPKISINDVSVAENIAGGKATFRISIDAASGQDITVDYATANGSATAGSDYTAVAATSATITAGTTFVDVTVDITNDTINEPDETYFINLTNPANATIDDAQALGTITNDDGLPKISINDVSVAENIASGAATFRISIDATSGQDITVDYATANGSATAGSDYTAVAATTATITAGTTFVDVTVDITNDTINEPDETYFVNLTNPANATIDDAQGLGTITNDDGLPKISINDVSVAENIAGGKATFRISIDAVSGQDITLDYATANGSATAGSDYTAVAATTATITAGTTFVDVTVDITNDTINEPDETYFVNLTNPANATIDDAQGLGTITNDDGLPKISINDVSVAEDIAGGKATFRISIDAASGQDITVDYATANGSATAGSDYTAVAATAATITAGTTFVDVTVDITNDAINEPDETYFVNLTNPANATIDDAQGLGTITNDDGLPKISINDVSVAENIAGGKATFRISIDATSGQDITVDYATANGSATAGTDFTAVAATSATITAGTTFVDVTVDITNDTINEPDETYFINLTNPANATIDDAQGLGTITNDDGLPKISINDVSAAENIAGGKATFRISIDAASGQDITVDYATADGSATAGSDYTAVAATSATITAGTTFVDVTVDITNDTFNEPDETYFVNLTNPANATIDDAQGLGTITNDDGLPKISVNDASVAENIAGGKATFRISIDAASGQDITVDYATADGSATAGSDYTAVAATAATITAGTTFVDVTVDITNDAINEPDETYFINLTNPANATIDDAQGLGTITNDDGLPKISVNDASVAENIAGGKATFRISIDAASGQDITVDYATADGSATAGSDYTAVAATATTITAGTTFVDVTVDITNDAINEDDETYFINLTNPANATIDDAQGLGTITNDDGLPKISINDVSAAENIASGKATFRISIDAASGQDITVDYATANGSATAGSDYTAVAATSATITAGMTFVDVTVDITNDTINEPDETYFVNLTNPANATIDDAQGLGTITNDDSVSDVTAPTSSVDPLPTFAATKSFAVSVTGTDPMSTNPTEQISGVATYDIYVAVNSGTYNLWTTVSAAAPSAIFNGDSFTRYHFISVAKDNAGNIENKNTSSAANEAWTIVLDFDAPQTAVTAVNSSTSTLTVDFEGTDHTLDVFEVWVSVDGAAPQLHTIVNGEASGTAGTFAGSVTYDALTDGVAHTYRFFTVGVDESGNREDAPTGANDDVIVTATFATPPTLQTTGLDVQNGDLQRSFIRYVDISFNTSNGLAAIVASMNDADATNDRIELTRFNLDGSGPGVSVDTGAIVVDGNEVNLDFGADGITGNRNSNAGDGYYRLSVDLDGDGTNDKDLHFYRMMGDTNGDRRVDRTDLFNVFRSFLRPNRSNADINGDGVVNVLDLIFTLRNQRKTVDSGLLLDD